MFVVHSRAVAATSSYFRALLTNGLSESQTDSVEYPDIKPDDFARFLEYTYRYDYTVPTWVKDEGYIAENVPVPPEAGVEEEYPDIPGPEAVPAPPVEEELPDVPESVPVPEPPVELDDDDTPVWRESRVFASQFFTRLSRMSLRTKFDKRNCLTSNEPQKSMVAAFQPCENTAPDEDFTPVFLAHARLYTFACMRLVDPLKRLTLHKLHETLLSFKLYKRRVGDVVELARYAYTQGEDRKDDGTKDELRQLVVEYIVLEVDTFGKHPAFVDLLHEGGEFVVDFWNLAYQEGFGREANNR